MIDRLLALATKEAARQHIIEGHVEWFKDCPHENCAAVRAGAALPQESAPKTCNWLLEFDGAYWDTECGQAFTLLAGSPSDNEMRFCPYCAHTIQVGSPSLGAWRDRERKEK